jgi:hypothetical protein
MSSRKWRARRVKGVVLFEGPSQIDGQPIVAIATLKTKNEKTGNMVQTWIIRADCSPIEAINTGEDASVCGDCPLRGIVADGRNVGRSCYVQVRNAPRAIWQAYRSGRYAHYSPAAHAHLFQGRVLRLGSYGDPTAVPLGVWEPLLRLARRHTGYTHQWRAFPEYRAFLMASVDHAHELPAAHAAGWRTFRTLAHLAELRAGERLCPASAEAGKRTTCDKCAACKGAGSNPQLVSIAIVAHGGKSTLSNYHKLVG